MMNMDAIKRIMFVNIAIDLVQPSQTVAGQDVETLIPTDFPDVDDTPNDFPDRLRDLRGKLVSLGIKYQSNYNWRYKGTGLLKIITAGLTAIVSGGYLGGQSDNPYLFWVALVNILLAVITALDSYFNFGRLAPLYFRVAYEYLYLANTMTNTWNDEKNNTNNAALEQKIKDNAQTIKANLDAYIHDVQIGKIPIPGVQEPKVRRVNKIVAPGK